MTEKNSYIESKELALEMAYAEKPFRELAKRALMPGHESVVDDDLEESANRAGIEAGRAYIAKLTESLDSYDPSSSETPMYDSLEMLKDFAKAKGYSAKMVGGAWNCVYRTAFRASWLHEEICAVKNEAGAVVRFRVTQSLIDEAVHTTGFGKLSQQFMADYLLSQTEAPASSS